MIIDAEYEEIEQDGEAMDFVEPESLPWLEADEEDEAAGGFDTSQIVGLGAILAVLGLIFVGIVYVLSNYDRGPVEIADGSLIEAPEGPYKERPADPGGKEFAGTNDVAPEVGQGGAPDGRLADSTGAGSGDQDLGVAMPAIGGDVASTGSGRSTNSGAGTTSGVEPSAPNTTAAASDTGGVGVQIGAFSSRARAQEGWTKLRRQTAALNGFKQRILEGQADRGPVFRLQAVAPTLSEANALCRALRADGLDCQVKS